MNLGVFMIIVLLFNHEVFNIYIILSLVATSFSTSYICIIHISQSMPLTKENRQALLSYSLIYGLYA